MQRINTCDCQLPSKHEALVHCWADVGPASTTLTHPQLTIGPTPSVYWRGIGGLHHKIGIQQRGLAINRKGIQI